MKGRHLKLIIVGMAVCYAAVTYGQDLMKTWRMREQRTQEVLEPELGRQRLPREEDPSRNPARNKPRNPLPPPEQRPVLVPKNPVRMPATPAEAAQYVRGERMEARVQGTLFLHQMKEKGVSILRDILQAGKGESRAAAVVALGWLGDASALVGMAQLAADPDPWVRDTMGEVLGLFQGPEAVSLLNSLTRDPDPRVRAAAAESLGLVGDAAGVESLNVLLDDQEESVREQAALALKGIWSPRKGPEAEQEPEPPPVTPAVREASLKGLARRLETDPSRRVRGYAAEALGGVGDPSVLDMLVLRLRDKDENEFVQYGAVLAIGRLGGGSEYAEKALRRAQRDNPSALVQRGVYDALRMLKLTPAARPGQAPTATETGWISPTDPC